MCVRTAADYPFVRGNAIPLTVRCIMAHEKALSYFFPGETFYCQQHAS